MKKKMVIRIVLGFIFFWVCGFAYVKVIEANRFNDKIVELTKQVDTLKKKLNDCSSSE